MSDTLSKKFVVAFAGPIGSSKSTISYYLSSTYSLPIFSTDAIRKEVTQDQLLYSIEEFEKLRDIRLKEIIAKDNSFILDASVDREWEKYKEWIENSDYKIFLISIDLDKDFLIKLHKLKIYDQTNLTIDKYMKDHEIFLSKNKSLVNFSINNDNFKDRLTLSSVKLNIWLKSS